MPTIHLAGQLAHAPLVLIVEDDADCRDMLANVLTIEGFGVLTARNGLEALNAARRHQPALILLDLMMPVMDGATFRAEQQRDLRISAIPVICLSGHHAAVQIAVALGTAGCVTKPIVFDDLLPMMGQCLPAEGTQRTPVTRMGAAVS